MKKFFTIAFLVSVSFASSAQRIQIVSGSSAIAPIVSKEPATRVDTVNLVLQLKDAFDKKDPSKNKITLHMQSGTIIDSVTPVFINGQREQIISLPASAWPGEGSVAQTTVPVYLRSKSRQTKLANDEAGQIEIKDDPSGFHVIRISNSAIPLSTKFQPQKSFWVEVGSNFDLTDGLQPNNFFSGVFFHKRDVREVISKTKNFGVFAGIYQSKTVGSTTDQDFSFKEYYDSSSFIPGVRDSMKIFKAVGSFTTSRVVKNLGLFFSPQLRLTNGSSNDDGLHFFTSLWVDLQWQKISEDKQFSQLRKQDSMMVHLNRMTDYRSVSYKKETDIRSHYLGIGFPIFYRESTSLEDVVQLFVNPVIGISNQPNEDYFRSLEVAEAKGMRMPYRKWIPFYIVQFRLNEEKYGISFTGEVRGLLARNNPPFVSLALSKKFDLTKFIEFTGK